MKLLDVVNLAHFIATSSVIVVISEEFVVMTWKLSNMIDQDCDPNFITYDFFLENFKRKSEPTLRWEGFSG